MTSRLRPEYTRYGTWLFDCDGVLLDSNRLKTEVFRQVALPFGEAASRSLVEYHVSRGGVSRYVKFRYFQEVVLGQPFDAQLQDELLSRFSASTLSLLKECPTTEGCEQLLAALPQTARAHVVSGGDQSELREVFAARGLDRYFASILGSPQTKAELIDSLRSDLAQPGASVFLGDSRADHEAAVYARADFVFVSKYTEFSDWRCFTASQPETRVVETLSELLA